MDRLDASLSECVTRAVRRYFLDMGDHWPHDLMAVVKREVESALLAEIMSQTRGTQSAAAEVLGISRSTLRKKLRQYGLL